MFEGKPPRFDDSTPLGSEADGDVLRPLEWTELAERLAAARDVRTSLQAADAGGEASFDAHSARWIAAHREGKEFVNLEDSVNGKGAGPSGAEAPRASRGGAVREA